MFWGIFMQVSYAQESPEEHEDKTKREFSNNPVDLVKKVYREANDEDAVQNTALDNVNSKFCNELSLDGKYTLARTLCSIKYWIRGYLQYVMYVWLAGATIFIIRNWFKIVTATDKESQMKKFKENIKYLIIWVILITCFYFILDVFVSIVNFIAE